MSYDYVADKFLFLLNLANYELEDLLNKAKNVHAKYANVSDENFEMEIIYFKEYDIGNFFSQANLE